MTPVFVFKIKILMSFTLKKSAEKNLANFLFFCVTFFIERRIRNVTKINQDVIKKETITMTNKMAMNKIDDFELNKVSGGTVAEFEEILDACNSHIGIAEDVFTTARKALDLLGPIGSAGKSAVLLVLSKPIEKALKHDFNIDAYISVGWGGTGFRSTHNRYSINGKSISQQEVINMIKAA